MAEARRGVLPVPALGLHESRIDITSHRVQLVLDRYGFVLFVPNVRFLLRNALRRVWRTRNKIHEVYNPLPAWFVLLVNVGSAAWNGYVSKHPQTTTSTTNGSNARRAFSYAPLPFSTTAHAYLLPLLRQAPVAVQHGVIGFCLSSVYLYLFSAANRCLIRSLLTYNGWIFEVRRKVSWKTKIWGLLLSCYVRSKGALLLSFQNYLPKQPVPALQDTIQRYLETIEPLVCTEEFNTLQTLAERFVKDEGRTLQRYLKFKYLISSNYVSEWWLNLVYLRSRSSLTINSNYYGLGCSLGVPTTNAVARAAVTIHNLVKVKLQIDHETLPPQCLQGIIPICMDQHCHAFSTTREPHMEQDKLVQYDSLESRHVVVIHKGRMYTVSCFSQHSRRPLTAKQLETTLRGIVEDTTPVDEIEASIPVLTSLDRTKWAQIRERCFQQDVVNELALEKIEKSLFVVCLDDFTPTNLLEEGRNLFIGDNGRNRWVDKSFNVVVTPNGKVGIEAEHSWGDAVAMSYILEMSYSEEVRSKPYERDGSVRRVYRDIQKGDKSQYPAERIRFNMTPELRAAITDAIPVVQTEVSDLDLSVELYAKYGKEFMKRARCSPDCWIQMALQLAYYRDQHRFDQTYESSTVRRFYMGRTETIRSVSKESCAFVRAMENPEVPREEVAKLLRIACEKHQDRSHRAFLGEGVDRHLFALYVVSVGMGIQSPFLKSVLSRKWSLSTSQTPIRQSGPGTWPWNDQGNRLPSPCGGFAPVADDGYGVSYNVAGDYRMHFHVSAKHSAPNTNARRFNAAIEKALDDMRTLFPDIPDLPLPAEYDYPYDKVLFLDDFLASANPKPSSPSEGNNKAKAAKKEEEKQ